MANVYTNATSGEVSVVATTAKTVLQIKAPTNQRILIWEVLVEGKAAAGGTDTPMKVRLTRSTANFGSAASSLSTYSKNNPSDSETLQATVTSNFNVEPTSPSDGGLWLEVQPQLSQAFIYSPTRPIVIPGGQSAQFEVTAPANQTVVITLRCEE